MERRLRWREASDKKLGSLRRGYDFYRALQENPKELPVRDREQIKLDTSRTFGVLRAVAAELGALRYLDAAGDEIVDALTSVLCAHCVRSRREAHEGRHVWCGFVQGMSYAGAIPLLLFEGDEEAAFGLAGAILDDVFGPCGVFAHWPPFAGCHALASAVTGPGHPAWESISEMLGENVASDVLASLCLKWLVPCFVGALPAPALLKLWDRLVEECVLEAERDVPPYWPLLAAADSVFHTVCPRVVEMLQDEAQHAEEDKILELQARAFGILARPGVYLPKDFDPCCTLPAGLVKHHTAALELLRADAVAPRLTSMGGFTEDEVTALRAVFEEMKANCSSPSGGSLSASWEVITNAGGGGLDYEDMLELLRRIGCSYSDEHLSVLFSLLDSTGEGTLHFFEVTVGLALLAAAGPAERLRLLFTLFDVDDTKKLSREELYFLAVTLLKVAESGGYDAPLSGRSRVSRVYARSLPLSIDSRFSSQPPRFSSCFSDGSPRVGSIGGASVRLSVQPETDEKARRLILRLDMLSDDSGDVTLDAWMQGALLCPEILAALAAVGIGSEQGRPISEPGVIAKLQPQARLPKVRKWCTVL